MMKQLMFSHSTTQRLGYYTSSRVASGQRRCLAGFRWCSSWRLAAVVQLVSVQRHVWHRRHAHSYTQLQHDVTRSTDHRLPAWERRRTNRDEALSPVQLHTRRSASVTTFNLSKLFNISRMKSSSEFCRVISFISIN